MKYLLIAAPLALIAACTPQTAATAPAPVETAAAPAQPEAKNGWREYPLRDGVLKLQANKWESKAIDIPVPKGGELEYKLAMKKGDGIVYTISYGDLAHPGLMVSEFHGHTPKGADGVGDLMFYSKTGGATEHGNFTAPWDGIHGWYLKNDGDKDVVVKLEVAGFYELTQ
jgi:hypothetical protein